MKWRPISFTSNMVKAIYRQTNPKTQTRRLQGLDRPNEEPNQWHLLIDHNGIPFVLQNDTTGELLGSHREIRCPYGQKGDGLWVKEAHYLFGRWVNNGETKTGRPSWTFVQIESPWEPGVLYEDCKPTVEIKTKKNERGWFKRSPLFMPRWAARTFLELTEDPRPERLQDINGRDAYAEGVIVSHNPIPVGLTWEETVGSAAIAAYQRLWDSINGKTHPWAENPWNWRIAFRRIEKEEDIAKRH